MTSILVRKHCQPILDQAGYPMFFCTISDDHYAPTLEIYTTCGKPFAHIHGVTFSRSRPTIAESEYSAVLLEQWLIRHKIDFEKYVDAYTDFYSAQRPKSEINTKTFSISILSTDTITVHRTFDYINKHNVPDTYRIKYSLDETAEYITGIHWPIAKLKISELASKITLPANIKNKALKLRAEHAKHWELRKRLDKATETMHSCKI